MERTITAIFEDGVLKPIAPLELPAHSLVRITVESLDVVTQRTESDWQELEQCLNEIEFDSGEPRPTRDTLNDRN